jgi:hypothetical protein
MISSAFKQNVWHILKVALGLALTLTLALGAIVAILAAIQYFFAPASTLVSVVVFLGIAVWSKHKLKALGKG